MLVFRIYLRADLRFKGHKLPSRRELPSTEPAAGEQSLTLALGSATADRGSGLLAREGRSLDPQRGR